MHSPGVDPAEHLGLDWLIERLAELPHVSHWQANLQDCSLYSVTCRKLLDLGRTA